LVILSNTLQRIITSVFAGSLFTVCFIYTPVLFTYVLIILLVLSLTLEWPQFTLKQPKLWLLTPFYPITPWIIMIILSAGSEHQRFLLALIYCTVFAFDTGAWVAGNLIGKHLLCPHISPKKTWEGFIGGFLSVLLILYGASIYSFTLVHTLYTRILIALTISIIATIGDLFESKLKRIASIKDSGNLLPGHGGLLDRFDGVLWVTFSAYLYQSWLILFILK
jgi:phosphatidate cytidylyltransferase